MVLTVDAEKAGDLLVMTTMSPYLHFNVYPSQGFPIATGVMERACRYLKKDRMDITGARWSVEGAEAVLRLRSLGASEDFEAHLTYHQEQEFKHNHAARYADAGKLHWTGLQAIKWFVDRREPHHSHFTKNRLQITRELAKSSAAPCFQ